MAKKIKILKTYKLSEATIKRIKELADKLEQDNTGVVELAIELLAKREKIK